MQLKPSCGVSPVLVSQLAIGSEYSPWFRWQANSWWSSSAELSTRRCALRSRIGRSVPEYRNSRLARFRSKSSSAEASFAHTHRPTSSRIVQWRRRNSGAFSCTAPVSQALLPSCRARLPAYRISTRHQRLTDVDAICLDCRQRTAIAVGPGCRPGDRCAVHQLPQAFLGCEAEHQFSLTSRA